MRGAISAIRVKVRAFDAEFGSGTVIDTFVAGAIVVIGVTFTGVAIALVGDAFGVS